MCLRTAGTIGYQVHCVESASTLLECNSHNHHTHTHTRGASKCIVPNSQRPISVTMVSSGAPILPRDAMAPTPCNKCKRKPTHTTQALVADPSNASSLGHTTLTTETRERWECVDGGWDSVASCVFAAKPISQPARSPSDAMGASHQRKRAAGFGFMHEGLSCLPPTVLKRKRPGGTTHRRLTSHLPITDQ
jgi:hypothetical protein